VSTRPSRYVLGLLFVVSSLLLSLLLAEVLLRVFFPQELIIPMPAMADPELIYRLPSNTKAFLKGTSVRWFHLETNSLGLRDREPSSVKRADTLHVMLLGDSMSMAEGVELEETYIKQLEYLANNTSGSRPIATTNAAIRGYGTDQEVVLFERLKASLHPDAVVLGFYEGNDFDDNREGGIFQLSKQQLVRQIPRKDNSPKFRYYRRQIQIQNTAGYQFLAARSHLFNLARKVYANLLFRKYRKEARQEVTDGAISQQDWDLTVAILRRWQADCEQARAIPIMLYIPTRDNVLLLKDGKNARRTDLRMGESARVNRILFVDLLEVFSRDPNPERLYLADGHLSPIGHQQTAQHLFAYFKEAKLL
jgi:hypothetical protein